MNSPCSKVVFITGANGFIGSNLTRLLIKSDYRVHVMLRKNADPWRIKDLFKNLKIHEGDILEEERLTKILKKINPNYIFHLASYGNSSSDINLDEMIKVNVFGLKNLLEATKEIDYKTFLITGSSSEYGFKKVPMSETDLLTPNSYYSATKASATLLAQSFALINNKPITIARPFSVYGPYEEENRLIPTVIKLALADKEIPLTFGNVQRDFIYVKDITEALLKMAETKLKHGEIINLGTGKQSGNDDVVKTIGEILNKKLHIKIGEFPKRSWDTNYWVADNHKAKKLLGWEPKYDLRHGLIETIDWYKNNY